MPETTAEDVRDKAIAGIMGRPDEAGDGIPEGENGAVRHDVLRNGGMSMIQNLRDLGGIRTADGRSIRPGLLVRSAQLLQAEEAELRGISTVIDLRTPGERREAPDRTHGRAYLPLPIFDDVQAGISHEQDAQTQGIPDMAMLYGRIVRECADAFSRVLLAIMRHDFAGGAVLWHCTEGKDRCGLTTALVLEALGVDREHILADYLKTNEVNLPKARAIRERLTATHGEAFAESVYQAYIADARYLQAAWEAMGEDYLRGRLAIPEAVLARFRQTVLAP